MSNHILCDYQCRCYELIANAIGKHEILHNTLQANACTFPVKTGLCVQKGTAACLCGCLVVLKLVSNKILKRVLLAALEMDSHILFLPTVAGGESLRFVAGRGVGAVAWEALRPQMALPWLQRGAVLRGLQGSKPRFV